MHGRYSFTARQPQRPRLLCRRIPRRNAPVSARLSLPWRRSKRRNRVGQPLHRNWKKVPIDTVILSLQGQMTSLSLQLVSRLTPSRPRSFPQHQPAAARSEAPADFWDLSATGRAALYRHGGSFGAAAGHTPRTAPSVSRSGRFLVRTPAAAATAATAAVHRCSSSTRRFGTFAPAGHLLHP